MQEVKGIESEMGLCLCRKGWVFIFVCLCVCVLLVVSVCSGITGVFFSIGGGGA